MQSVVLLVNIMMYMVNVYFIIHICFVSVFGALDAHKGSSLTLQHDESVLGGGAFGLELHTKKRQITAPQMKLVDDDLEANAEFGWSTALSSDGNTALIGARSKDEPGSLSAGATYVFIRNGAGQWSQQMKIVADEEDADNDRFGQSVALSSDGNTALIGAYKRGEGGLLFSGASYVMIRNDTGQWIKQMKLAADDVERRVFFGWSGALSSDGNTALIGSYWKNEGAFGNAGAAYVFVRDGTEWAQQMKLVANDLETDGNFGYSVALSSDGNTALIGALYKNEEDFIDAGACYVFLRDGGQWSQQMKLLADDLEAGAFFGHSVALSSDGNTALIGARDKNEGGFGAAGACYVFVRDLAGGGGQWLQQAKLVTDELEGGANFGESVALSSDGNTALVGAYRKIEQGYNAGASYMFIRNGTEWSQQMKLLADDLEADSRFGFSVALSSDGNTALIGAYNKNEGDFSGAGACYVFNFSPPTLSPTVNPTTLVTNAPTLSPTPLPFTDAPTSSPPVIDGGAPALSPTPLPFTYTATSLPPVINGGAPSATPSIDAAPTAQSPTLSSSIGYTSTSLDPSTISPGSDWFSSPESNNLTGVALLIAGFLSACGILASCFLYRYRRNTTTSRGRLDPESTTTEAPMSTLRARSRSTSRRRQSVGRIGSMRMHPLPPNLSSSQELKRSPRDRSPRSGSRSRSHSKLLRSRSQSRSSRRSQHHYQSFAPPSLDTSASSGTDIHSLEVESRHIIDQSELNKTKLLGSGNFGEVWKAEWQGVAVAVKEVKGIDQASTDQLILEAQRFQSLRAHPNVVAFYGVVTQPTLAVVMEFCPNGSLDEALYGEKGRRSFTRSQLLTIARGIVLGVAHLHRANIIHRDLAARNVLLDAADNPKVTDFGMSRTQTGYNQMTQTAVGPIKWMAPEQMAKQAVSKQADIWALGVVLYEVFAQRRPWDGKRNVEVAHAVMKGESLEPPQSAPVEVKQAMRACFHHDPSKRPDAFQLAKLLASEPVYQEVSAEALSNYDIITLSGSTTASTSLPPNQYNEPPKKTASSSSSDYQQPPRAPVGY